MVGEAPPRHAHPQRVVSCILAVDLPFPTAEPVVGVEGCRPIPGPLEQDILSPDGGARHYPIGFLQQSRNVRLPRLRRFGNPVHRCFSRANDVETLPWHTNEHMPYGVSAHYALPCESRRELHSDMTAFVRRHGRGRWRCETVDLVRPYASHIDDRAGSHSRLKLPGNIVDQGEFPGVVELFCGP